MIPKMFQCVVPTCTCENFVANKLLTRICDNCQHIWIAHALPHPDADQSRHLMGFSVEIVQPTQVFGVASLILYGTQAVPVRLKILLDRLFSVIGHEEEIHMLGGLGWAFEDYTRGYIIQDSTGRALEKWSIVSSNEERLILYQFLRFGETRSIAQDIILQQFHDRFGFGSIRSTLLPTIPGLMSSHESAINQQLALDSISETPSYQSPHKTMRSFQNPMSLFSRYFQPHWSEKSVEQNKLATSAGEVMTENSYQNSSTAHCTAKIDADVNRSIGTPHKIRNYPDIPCMASTSKSKPELEAIENLAKRISTHEAVTKERSNAEFPFSSNSFNMNHYKLEKRSEEIRNSSSMSRKLSMSGFAKRQMIFPYLRSATSSIGHNRPGHSTFYGDLRVKQLRRSSVGPMRRPWQATPGYGGTLVSPNGKKRVLCSACNKTFCDKGALKIHYSAVHLKEMHKCTIDGCNMMFSSRRSRNRHSANPNTKLHMDQRRKVSSSSLEPLQAMEPLLAINEDSYASRSGLSFHVNHPRDQNSDDMMKHSLTESRDERMSTTSDSVRESGSYKESKLGLTALYIENILSHKSSAFYKKRKNPQPVRYATEMIETEEENSESKNVKVWMGKKTGMLSSPIQDLCTKDAHDTKSSILASDSVLLKNILDGTEFDSAPLELTREKEESEVLSDVTSCTSCSDVMSEDDGSNQEIITINRQTKKQTEKQTEKDTEKDTDDNTSGHTDKSIIESRYNIYHNNNNKEVQEVGLKDGYMSSNNGSWISSILNPINPIKRLLNGRSISNSEAQDDNMLESPYIRNDAFLSGLSCNASQIRNEFDLNETRNFIHSSEKNDNLYANRSETNDNHSTSSSQHSTPGPQDLDGLSFNPYSEKDTRQTIETPQTSYSREVKIFESLPISNRITSDHSICPNPSSTADINQSQIHEDETSAENPSNGYNNDNSINVYPEDNMNQIEPVFRENMNPTEPVFQDNETSSDRLEQSGDEDTTGWVRADQSRSAVCHICALPFIDNLVLKEHLERVHPREMFHCTVLGCDKIFSTRKSRNRHSQNENLHSHILSDL